MVSKKTISLAAFVLICMLLTITGCQESQDAAIKTTPDKKAQESAKIALKFVPQTKATYKSVMMSQMSLDFEGSLAKDPSFSSNKNENRAEMVFTQEILSVDRKGIALIKITIDAVKFISIFKNDTMLDVDSSRDADKNNPIAKLVGQTYNITLTPSGQVRSVTKLNQALAAIRGSSGAHKAAKQLLDPAAVKERHSILALPEKAKVKTGSTWSNNKSFEFPLVGPKSYERVYTFEKIKSRGGKQSAVVKMTAIPSTPDQSTEETHASSALSKMFDNTETFTGTLKLNLTTGEVDSYSEKLDSQWLIIDPAAKTQDNKELDTITMGAVRLRSLRKIQ